MSKKLTIIWWLPWVWKTTLWEWLEKMDSQIVYCDYDKVFDSILKNPKALSIIWNTFIPEINRLAFLKWDIKIIVRSLIEDKMLMGLFQRGVFLWSVNILENVQKTKNATFWIIGMECSNKISRQLIKEQAWLEKYDIIDFIELKASRNELLKTADEREKFQKSESNFIEESPTIKLWRNSIIDRINQYEPYKENEKLFDRNIKISRKDFFHNDWMKKISDWIKWV